jgi:hypothetical protein
MHGGYGGELGDYGFLHHPVGHTGSASALKYEQQQMARPRWAGAVSSTPNRGMP